MFFCWSQMQKMAVNKGDFCFYSDFCQNRFLTFKYNKTKLQYNYNNKENSE